MNFRQKITLYLLLSIVLGSVAFAQVVDIPDPNLHAGIADALGIPRGTPITQEDMNRLTDLDVQNQGIANLTGLEFATNLTFLQLKSNRIEDISPLGNLTQLTDLHLGGNRIEDISPLANLTQLTVLRLNENGRIEDISSLANLTQLKVADLDRNEIVDVSPIARLTNLESLDLRGNRIIDASPLANLMQLNELRLSENQIIDINPLANLTNLAALWLSDNQITDVTALAHLTQLTQLLLSNNRIEDVSPLENLTNLEQLDTHNNPIFDPDSPLVEVPDPNLRAAVREALNLPHGVPLTQASMRQLTTLSAGDRQIESLTGLEYATNLTFLHLRRNRIEDISPLGNLMQLTELNLSKNSIVNVSPLENLIQLTKLYLEENRIVDVRPLKNLIQLTELYLRRNRIVDVRPLARLIKLESLDLLLNPITDYSSLNGLTLTNFLYDELCELPPVPIHDRIQNRIYPSVFAAFEGPVLNRPELSYIEEKAIHDLWLGADFGVEPKDIGQGMRFAGILESAIQERDELLDLNPNLIFLAYVPYVAFDFDALPDDWPHWAPEPDGERNGKIWEWVDFVHPEVQDVIVGIALAADRCGLFDGIIIDHAREDIPYLRGYRSHEEVLTARENILRRIRAEARPDFLIAVNTNRSKIPRTGRYVNGLSMESSVPGPRGSTRIGERLSQIETTLLWADNVLREPHITHLEGQVIPTELPDSPTNLRWMRLITTLCLTHSDGSVMFGANVHDTSHYWYDFWDADLGRPVGPKAQLYDEDIPGLYIREFTNGWAVYNHSGSPQVIRLPEEAQGVASGLINVEHALPNLDGEIYLRVSPENPADVNGGWCG